MARRYKRNSNLRATPVETNNLGLYVPPIEIDYTQTREFVVTQKYVKRPDLVAYELYGDAKFWWVIALYNRNQLLDPINDFVLGLRLFVPNRDYIAGI